MHMVIKKVLKMVIFKLLLVLQFIKLTRSYLPSTQIFALEDLYRSLNGDAWKHCHWNLQQLSQNKTLPDIYCGLYIKQLTNNTHTVYKFWVGHDNNLNGTISKSIGILKDLEIIKIFHNPLLTGIIPDSICQLQSFHQILIADTNVHGNVPICMAKMSSLELINFKQLPLLSMNDTFIESLCIHAHALWQIHLQNINYTGPFPECIGYDLLKLQYFMFEDMPLSATLPQSMNNLSQLVDLTLFSLPNLYGTFPPEIFKNNPNLYKVMIYETSLSGNISIYNLCNNANILNSLHIMHNVFLSPLTIPNCIGSLKYLELFHIGDGTTIHGTIPEEICNITNLLKLEISNSSISGTVPQCIGHNLINLFSIDLHSNKLIGDFPSLKLPKLKVLDIHSNQFIGSLSTIFVLEKYSYLEVVVLHNNSFVDHNIGIVLQKLFQYSLSLKGVAIYGNEISGIFPTFVHELYLPEFEVLAIQQLNIGGVLPNNVFFGNENASIVLSIYDNKLSSIIPKQLITANNIRPIILPGNLFTIYDNDDIPHWMQQSNFTFTEELYLTNVNLVTSWVVLIVAFMCYVVAVIKQKYKLLIQDTDIEFIENIKKIICRFILIIINLYIKFSIILLFLYLYYLFHYFIL
eukprot:97264_1